MDLPNKQYPLHALYGDGSEIEEEVVQHIRDTAWTCSYGFQMRKGDVIILDNMYIQHGRLSFTDERRLLTSLIEFWNSVQEKKNKISALSIDRWHCTLDQYHKNDSLV